VLALWNALIRGFDVLSAPNFVQPGLQFWILVQRKLSIAVLEDPWIEMSIDSGEASWENTVASGLFQLLVEDFECPVGLCYIPVKGIFILLTVIMSEPIYLTHHRPKAGDEEKYPFVEVDMILLGAAAWTKLVLFVIYSEKVVDAGTALPGGNVCVWILESRNSAILVDSSEFRAFDTILGIFVSVSKWLM